MIFFMIMFILEGSAVFGIQIWSIWWMNLVLYNAMNWRNGRIFAANASEKRLDSGANWFFLYSNERSSFKPQTFCKLIWWELLINASPTYQNWFKSGTNFHGDVLSYFLCTFFGVLSLYSNLTSWISLDPPRDPPPPRVSNLMALESLPRRDTWSVESWLLWWVGILYLEPNWSGFLGGLPFHFMGQIFQTYGLFLGSRYVLIVISRLLAKYYICKEWKNHQPFPRSL